MAHCIWRGVRAEDNPTMRGCFRIVHSFVLLVFVLMTTPTAGAAELADRLRAQLGAPPYPKARVAVLVTNATTGSTVFAHEPDLALAPASNQKVLTAMAALATFGPSHRFETVLLSHAPIGADGAIDGLVVRGGGDPGLTSEQYWRLAADLRRAGLRQIRGDVLLDDSIFDREPWNAAWGSVGGRAYQAAVGGLTANYGSFSVEIRPGGATGSAGRVTVDPPIPYLRLESAVRTGSKEELRIDRQAAGDFERVIVSGTVARGAPPVVYYRSVADPLRYAGAVLRMQLEANGISVAGAVRSGTDPNANSEILRFQGPTLGELTRLLLKFSNNFIAESLVKQMGRRQTKEPGSWENGLVAVRRTLESAGINLSGVTLLDGSGLARGNRIPPSALVRTMAAAIGRIDIGAEFLAALPLAGTDGTLQYRAKDLAGSLRAKTGLIARATGLSGILERPGGERWIFAILLNDYDCSDAEAMAAIDRFVASLATD